MLSLPFLSTFRRCGALANSSPFMPQPLRFAVSSSRLCAQKEIVVIFGFMVVVSVTRLGKGVLSTRRRHLVRNPFRTLSDDAANERTGERVVIDSQLQQSNRTRFCCVNQPLHLQYCLLPRELQAVSTQTGSYRFDAKIGGKAKTKFGGCG